MTRLAERVDRLRAEFERATGRPPSGVWAAPGRVNLIGEHTDYNLGFVLPMALQYCVLVAAAPSVGGASTVRSLQMPGEVTFVASSVARGDVPGWAGRVAGVFWAMLTEDHAVVDLDLVVDGDIPLGAGLSSSHALECGVALALSDLTGADLGKTTVALLTQRVENDFIGVPTGVMDQMASLNGREGSLVFIDTRSLECEPVPFPLDEHGLCLLVIDTKAPRQLVESAYGDRRDACMAAARTLGVASLRAVAYAELGSALAALPDPVMRRRVRHVVSENERVLTVVRILRSGADPRAIGPALTASHVSLRDDFEVSAPPLDIAVDAALAAGAHGARMTGGGFGGCAIALVELGTELAVAREVSEAFASAGLAAPATFGAIPSAGARRVWPSA